MESQGLSNSRCLGYDKISIGIMLSGMSLLVYNYIIRRRLCVARSTFRAMRRPLAAGRVTSTDPALFILLILYGIKRNLIYYEMFRKAYSSSIICILLNVFSCKTTDINSIGDPHFDVDGTPLDTVEFFVPKRPSSAKLYIETSGSMNGFFRANQANKFKKTVWSVFSGLHNATDKNVYTMSNGGDIDTPISLGEFRKKMNGGGFVSNTSTQIPMMLLNIIKQIDPEKDEVAVLVSDMKYSPMGKDAAPTITQFQEQIRNLTIFHDYGVAFICADSEYFNSNNTVAEQNSPYYYIVIGKPENVAALRNDIVAWCEDTNSYIDSGDMGMKYKNPPYSLHSINNGVASADFPNNLITSFSREVSDTCSFIVRLDMTGYPAGKHPILVDSCFNVTTSYGASVSKELINMQDDHHVKGSFERKAYADFLVKVFDLPLDDEVLEFTFNNRSIDTYYTDKFIHIINGEDEKELDRSFSFNKFIEGHFNARFNEFDKEPGRESEYEPRHQRILISHNY